MSQLVESLKRLYSGGELSLSIIDELLNKKKITDEEYKYIVESR